MNETTITPDLTKPIKDLLFLDKPETTVRNILAMLGLYLSDFGGQIAPPLWTGTEILIRGEAYDLDCTCDPKDPKIFRVDQALHSNRCALAIWERIQAHPCLTRIERDGEDLYYTFQWPRDLEPFREPICIAFKEQNQNIQWWDGFKRSWALITRDMGPMPPSLREQTEAVEPIPNDDGDVDFAADIDFGSPDTPTLPPQADIPNIPLNAPAPPKVKRGPGRPPKEKLPPPPTPSSRLDTRLTLVNITCLLNNALADLAREPNQIEVWTEFSAALKEARELAEAVKTLMAQPGA